MDNSAQGVKGKNEKPLFIPLKREYWEAFRDGRKMIEYRPFGPRWNYKTCVVGRSAVLSLGYGKRNRLIGVIGAFCVNEDIKFNKSWRAVYGDKKLTPAAILIQNIQPLKKEVTHGR